MKTRPWLLVVCVLLLVYPVAAAEPTAKVPPYLPDDTKAIMILNVDNLVASKQFKQKDLKAIHDEWYRSNFTPVLKSDPVNSPIRKLSSATVAFPAAGESRALVVFQGDFDAKLLHQQMAANQTIKEDGKEGDTVIYKQKLPKGGVVSFNGLFPVEPAENVWFALVDEHTWVASTRSRDEIVRAVRIKAGKDQPALNAAMKKLIDATPIEKDSMSFLLVNHELPEKIRESMPKETERVFKQCQQMVGYVRYGPTIEMSLEYVGKSPQDAVEAEKAAKGNLQTIQNNVLDPLKPAVIAYDLAVLAVGKDNVPADVKQPAVFYRLMQFVVSSTKIERNGSSVRIQASAPADKVAILAEGLLPIPKSK